MYQCVALWNRDILPKLAVKWINIIFLLNSAIKWLGIFLCGLEGEKKRKKEKGRNVLSEKRRKARRLLMCRAGLWLTCCFLPPCKGHLISCFALPILLLRSYYTQWSCLHHFALPAVHLTQVQGLWLYKPSNFPFHQLVYSRLPASSSSDCEAVPYRASEHVGLRLSLLCHLADTCIEAY